MTNRFITQLSLIDEVLPASVVVNVASVPQRSPFRYPGGKTWLVPKIRQWLGAFPEKPIELIEPFAGGAIVGLTAAFENLAEHVTLIERDEQVSAVWRTIITDRSGAEWLARQIEAFEMTPDSLAEALTHSTRSTRQQAFQTILKNRTNHGGILAPGAGVLKHGENGKGLLSRWYPATLARRIRAIGAIRDRLTFIQGDGLEMLKEIADRSAMVCFIDPPYTASAKRAGSRLYTYHQIDHEDLFSTSSRLAGDFLMTYDDADEVRSLASRHNLVTRLVAMNNTHHATMTELLIGRNLDWLKD